MPTHYCDIIYLSCAFSVNILKHFNMGGILSVYIQYIQYIYIYISILDIYTLGTNTITIEVTIYNGKPIRL